MSSSRRPMLFAGASLLVALSGQGAASAALGGEVRGIWVTRWDYRNESDVRDIIANCARLGLNRVMFQVRGQADAFYRSSLEPWGEDLCGEPQRGGDPGFDPLEVAAEEARRHRIELHAWVNVLTGWKGSRPPRSKKHLVHAHPEWFLMDQAGRRRLLERDRYSLLNPCLPAVRRHLRAVVGEIAGRYPVDGIQIDYIRFLSRDRGEDVPFDPVTLALFRASGRSSPGEDPAAWDRFRREAIDRLVAEISWEVRSRRPACILSVAAIRDAEYARAHLFQDAEAWVKKGWVDEVYPMNYEREAGRFALGAQAWTRSCGGKAVVVGVGAHLLEAGPLREQIRIVREPKAADRGRGYCLFSYAELFPSRSPESKDDARRRVRRAALRNLVRALNPVAPGTAP